MYLSLIRFTRESIHAQCRSGVVANLFREHQMIWNLFDNTPEQQRDFLYRREDRPGHVPFYYLLSSRIPRAETGNITIETKPFEPVLRTGEHLNFLLRANAVLTRKADDHSKRHIRRDIIDAKVDEYRKKDPARTSWPPPSMIHHEAAQEWLLKQGEKHGFQPEECRVFNHRFHKVTKPGDPNKRQFSSLDIQGQLKLTEPEAFIEILTKGLGRSKAFGCGLLLIKRAY